MSKKAKTAENAPENVDKNQAAAKLNEFLEKGKKAGSVAFKDLKAMFDELHLNSEQIDKFYETLESLNIEVVDEDFSVTITDDMLPEHLVEYLLINKNIHDVMIVQL